MKYLPAAAFVAFIGTLVSLSPVAEASPWTQDQGEYFLQLGESFYHASTYRDGEGVIREGDGYTSLTTYTYGEVGLWDDLHGQFYVPFVFARANWGNEQFDEWSFGDAQFSIQASPLDFEVPTSVRLETKIPLYTLPDRPQAPAPGDNQIDFTLWLSVGGGLHAMEIPLYFYLDGGYTYRTEWNFDPQFPGGDFSDALVYHAEAGYTIADTFDVGLMSSAVFPIDPNYAAGIDESYIIAGPSLYWPVTDRIAVDFGGYFTPYSRNSGTGWSLSAGVALINGE